jgi:hypothetical protein
MPGEEHHLRYTPESSAVSRLFVGWSALSALLLLVVSIVGLYGIYRATVPNGPAPAIEIFSQPRVDTHESEELHRRLESQTRKLDSWGWSDARHTLAQIPIERAMQLLAQKGNSAYAPLLSDQQALSQPTAAAEQTTIEGEKRQSPMPVRK